MPCKHSIDLIKKWSKKYLKTRTEALAFKLFHISPFSEKNMGIYTSKQLCTTSRCIFSCFKGCLKSSKMIKFKRKYPKC